MCCLFGLLDPQNHLSGRQKAKVIRALSLEAEVRGRDACGIAYNSHGSLHIYKRPGPASQTRFFIPEDARVIMGHTRMTTQGSEKWNRNNHPFPGKAGGMRFALAHNGVLYHDKSLRRSRHLPKTTIQTDSYVAVQLLEQLGALTPYSLKEMAETVEDSFVFTVLDQKDTLYFVKGSNPLTVYHQAQLGLYLYASTQTILDQAIRRTWLAGQSMTRVPAAEGEILQINTQGRLSRIPFDVKPCLEQLPYLAACCSSCGTWPDREYLRTLKSVASSLGCPPEEIDRLLAAGYSTDEIEDGLYSTAEW